MSLDVRTILVIFSLLAFMFFCLLELAGLQVGKIRGVRQWAVANLCTSAGFGFAYVYTSAPVGDNWAFALGASFIAIGVSLQFTGIQAFKEKRSDWRMALLFVLVFVAQSIWFSVLYPDIYVRCIVNSLLFALASAACARELLIQVESPLKTAYWVTGISFTILAFVMLARAVSIWLSPSESYGLYVNRPLNSLTFTFACMLQFCVTFGFILMLNYRLIEDLQKLASLDPLTGALNRRRLEDDAARLKARSIRTGETLAIMMIDIDHFKSINDRFGHPVGDDVLRRLADIAQKSVRVEDYFARYGGEEFCMLLPATTEKDAHELAERLRVAYSKYKIELGKDSANITVSIGVADSATVGLDFSALVAAADQALYQAKQGGRNQVVSYSAMP